MLKEVTRTHRIVIVVSHWKGPELHLDDLLSGDVEAIRSSISMARHPEAALLLARVQRERPGKAAELMRVLSGFLNDQAKQNAKPKKRPDGFTEVMTLQTAKAEIRERMDGWLEGYLEPGNRLELFDGIHSREAIEKSISPAFRGVLDLTTCTSTYLSDYVDR